MSGPTEHQSASIQPPDPSAARETPVNPLEAMVTPTEVLRCRSGEAASLAPDSLAREEPLEIRVGGQSVAVTMRTPGHDIELAAGFLLSEALIRQSSDLAAITHCGDPGAGGNVVNVFLDPARSLDLSRLTRHVFASSSCGICGKASIESIHQQFPPITSELRIPDNILHRLPDLMYASQNTFGLTGGLHAAAIFDSAGALVCLREDVGRHNAVDKVLGYGLLRGTSFAGHILLVSGRASFEILQKALSAHVPIVCAISAPSSLAVDFARASGQTLIGFLRNGGMNIYSSAHRIVMDAQSENRNH